MSDTPSPPPAADPEAFRAQVRAWLEVNCPPTMRNPTPPGHEVWGGTNPTFPDEDSRLWFERAVAAGYTAPTWPVAYGGAGLTKDQGTVFAEEMARQNCRPPIRSFGIWMLGPVLMKYGTEEQKLRWLPGIARGETRWCQGYSEPDAGSDLAGLQTRAVRDGDDYVIDGAKIWTSHADHADWMFCLVRTDFDAPKREGISFILIDMRSPGIAVRPIELISGASPFCETYFDNVRVPAANLVGKENAGWGIAKALLEHERALISRLRDANLEETETLAELARRTYGDGLPPDLRDRITQIDMDATCQNLTLRRSREAIEAGRGPGPETSMFKLYGTELNQRRKELRVVLAGYRGLGWNDPGLSDDELLLTRQWLRSRGNTIEGGTSEIQLNIIAKRVLGLPD